MNTNYYLFFLSFFFLSLPTDFQMVIGGFVRPLFGRNMEGGIKIR